MTAEYLGKVNGIATISELMSSTGGNIGNDISGTTNDITFLKFIKDNKLILIADRNIRSTISWNDLNSRGIVFGKELTLTGGKYIVRLIKGANSDPSDISLPGGEWNDCIVNFVPNTSDSNWQSISSWCQETYTSSSYAITRGRDSLSTMAYATKTYSSSTIGWRPVLELSCKISNSISDQNLGNKLTWSNINYIITGDTHSIVEKLDGTEIKNISNQVDGTSYSLDLTSRWESLSYGKHIVEVIAIDTNGLSNTVTIKFNKIKSPITKLPTGASLVDRANFTQEMNKELDFQLLKLKTCLAGKGVEILPTDKISNLIDKVKYASLALAIDTSKTSIIFACPKSSLVAETLIGTIPAFSYKVAFTGSVCVEYRAYSPTNTYWNSFTYVDVLNKNNEIKFKGEVFGIPDNSTVTRTVELSSLVPGDLIRIFYYTTNNLPTDPIPSDGKTAYIGDYKIIGTMEV